MFSEKINTIPGGMNCSLKTKHNNTQRNIVFSETHTHSEYRMVQIWLPNEDARKIESWGPGIIPDKGGDVGPDGESADSQRFQGGRRRRWSSSPGVIPGRVGSGVPGG